MEVKAEGDKGVVHEIQKSAYELLQKILTLTLNTAKHPSNEPIGCSMQKRTEFLALIRIRTVTPGITPSFFQVN